MYRYSNLRDSKLLSLPLKAVFLTQLKYSWIATQQSPSRSVEVCGLEGKEMETPSRNGGGMQDRRTSGKVASGEQLFT